MAVGKCIIGQRNRFIIIIFFIKAYTCYNEKLEDRKVLRRSPDLFNNVIIGQGFTGYYKTYFVLPNMGVAAILVK